MDCGTDKQEREAKAAEMPGGQHPDPNPENNRANARRELGQPQTVLSRDGHSRRP